MAEQTKGFLTKEGLARVIKSIQTQTNQNINTVSEQVDKISTKMETCVFVGDAEVVSEDADYVPLNADTLDGHSAEYFTNYTDSRIQEVIDMLKEVLNSQETIE